MCDRVVVVAAVVMDTSNTGGAAAAITPDPTMEQIVTDMVGASHLSMSRVIGTLGSDLDCRFCNVRTKETTAGNFVCDIVLNTLHVDVCLINSGSFRSDMVHPAGDFTLGDLVKARPLSETRHGLHGSCCRTTRPLLWYRGWHAPHACCVCCYTGRADVSVRVRASASQRHGRVAGEGVGEQRVPLPGARGPVLSSVRGEVCV